MTLQEIKAILRNGKYAWPGGYPMYFLADDGETLSFEAVRQEWRQVVYSHLHDLRDGWHIEGCGINWEDGDMICAHTNERIESAYAEPEHA
jgi:hypothetical protein